MDPMQYLVTTAVRDARRGDLAFSALPDAPVMPIRPSPWEWLGGPIRTLVGLGRDAAARRPRPIGHPATTS